jgi:hypothetical protein
MSPNQVLVLASMMVAAQSATGNQEQGALTWGATWRTSHRQNDSVELVVLGARRSIPVDIVVSNRGKVPLSVAIPVRALVFQIAADDKTMPGRLTCENGVQVQRVKDGTTIAVEAVTSEELVLAPEDAIESKCELARVDGQPINPGHYRILANTPGWQHAAVRETFWKIELREPSTQADRRLLHFTEGDELFRQEDYVAAAKQFELARTLDPTDVMTTMALARAYQRLTKYNEAVVLLEGLVPLAEQQKLDAAIARVLMRQLALNYVAGGKEEQASRLLLRNGFTPDEARTFIATARAAHATPPR